jgi:aminopeptidase
MRDPRLTQLATNLINYAVALEPGEPVLIENFGIERELVEALVEAAYAAGGHPFVLLKDNRSLRKLYRNASEEQIQLMADIERKQMQAMDACIGLRAGDNINELSDGPAEQMKLYGQTIGKMHTQDRVNGTKWVVLRFPAGSMAQLANQSTEAFEDFYFDVCTLDYEKMGQAVEPLVDLMNRTDSVRLVGPGTDHSFSMNDIPAIKCAGIANIPDGEVFTAPGKDSVNGVISYNTLSSYQGFTFEIVKLTFKDGKIVEASANDTDRINQVFDTDAGSRFVGEFAIGVNPFIQHPMKDILFDEKIDGSFHFTPGQPYEEAYNGNDSSVHWDLVNIQRPDYGGGEIWSDDVLIRKDGRFVLPELEVLNPENLK